MKFMSLEMSAIQQKNEEEVFYRLKQLVSHFCPHL